MVENHTSYLAEPKINLITTATRVLQIGTEELTLRVLEATQRSPTATQYIRNRKQRTANIVQRTYVVYNNSPIKQTPQHKIWVRRS